MVKQQSLKSWLKKTKSQRHVKSLADVRLLLRPSKCKRSHSEYVCTLCGEQGALLACIKCLKLFHLICLGVTVLNLPLSEWACSACSQEYHNDFLSSLSKSIETQTQEKEAILRKLGNKLNKAQKNTKLRDFEAKFPHLVKHGQIVYPIPDEILWTKPKLHNLEYKSPPCEHMPLFPNDLLEDIIYICDFSHCFQSILVTPCFKCESLYSALASTEETLLSKQLHISLMRPLVSILLKAEAFRKKGPFLNYLVYKTKKLVPLDRLLDFSYLTFFENLFQTEVWILMIEDIDKELLHAFRDFSFTNNYNSLPIAYKIKLLVLLTNLLLETKIFNDECNRRLEIHTKILRENAEIQAVIRQKKTKPSERAALEEKLEVMKSELKSVPIRSQGFALDRFYREFYLFQWDKSKIYIKTQEKSTRETFKWTYYEKKHEIDSFVKSLSDKGLREAHLIDQISEIFAKNEFISGEAESTSSETEEPKKHTENVYNLNTLKNWLRDLHLSISSTLRVAPSSPYLTSLDTSDLISIPLLFINFHQAFTDNSDDIHKALRKVSSLWEMCELHSLWENSVKESQNLSELFLCMHLLDYQVHKFNEENKVVDVQESAYTVARRSYRLERLSKMKKEVEKTQDLVCYLCGECGLVVCCDKCPKVAHMECLKVEMLPEGEWLCPVCVEKASSVRVTRSKHIKF